MAQDRFYFWRGYYDALATLPTDEQRGRFVMAICQYAFCDEVPDLSDDPVLMFAWMVVRDQIAESVDIGRKQAERGRRSGAKRKGKPKPNDSDEHRSNTVPNSVQNTVANVRYGSVPSGYAPSLTVPALAADSERSSAVDATSDPRWIGVEPMSEEEARKTVTAILASMEEQERGDA